MCQCVCIWTEKLCFEAMRNYVCALSSRSALMARHHHAIAGVLQKHVAVVCTILCCFAMLGAYLVFQTYFPPAYSISEQNASQRSAIVTDEYQSPGAVSAADVRTDPATTTSTAMPVNRSVIRVETKSTRDTSKIEKITPILAPVYKIMHGAEAVWQIPREPRAAVFYAHGCTHKATHFWDKHPDCPKCFGLPEDRALVLAALNRHYAVLAVSRIDNHESKMMASKLSIAEFGSTGECTGDTVSDLLYIGVCSSNVCWDVQWPPSLSKDVQAVVKIIATWRDQNNLDALPLYALGASSGGIFVSVLAHAIQFNALAIMIASGVFVAFTTPLDSGVKYPPSLFVHMPKDKGTATGVKRAIDELGQLQVAAIGLPCREIPINRHYFSDRIPGINEELSGVLYGVFVESGDVTIEGFLKQDGRRMAWYEQVVNRTTSKNYTQIIFDNEMSIEEELNLAYAYHEMTSLKSSAIFDWFDGTCTMFDRVEPQRCHS